MDIRNYQLKPETPLSFEEWKGNRAPQFSEETLTALNRLHKVDYKKEFDEMLRNEYNEYLGNINGNWLLND